MFALLLAVAAAQIEPGQRIAAADLVDDPRGIAAVQAVGRTAARRIAVGRPLLAYDLRPDWLIRRGSPVAVVFRDGPLEIRTEGRSLANAVSGERARAAIGARQVEGVVDARGNLVLAGAAR